MVPPHSPPKFPPHTSGRTWLITAAATPMGTSICRQALEHGDNVVCGVQPAQLSILEKDYAVMFDEVETEEESEEDSDVFKSLYMEQREGRWEGRCKMVALDGRMVASCQSVTAIAEADFGSIDIMVCCDGETLIGTVEEVGSTPRARSLVRQMFETNFFGPVNVIKAALPGMRRNRDKSVSHIIVVSSVANHLGTPGLGTTCAAGWALDGFCDSLAYEVAPFNIRISIVQPNLEVNVLTHKITAAPAMEDYGPDNNSAPLFRGIIGGLLDRIEGEPTETGSSGRFMSDKIQSVDSALAAPLRDALVAETVYAILAIAGHENPPARHIVGFEGVASVKEKLKTVSEELEDFVGSSCAVDIDPGDHVMDSGGDRGMNGGA